MNQQYEFEKLDLSNATLITPFCAEDFRGEIRKLYSKEMFEKHGIFFEPVEDIVITSKKGVIRGLHFQKIEGQAKLIRVIKGKILAVILHINKNSITYGKWISIELTDDGKGIYVPGDCAFGSMALEDSILWCQCDSKFIAEYSDGIIWNDDDVDISWPLTKLDSGPILSERDKKLKTFKECMKDEK